MEYVYFVTPQPAALIRPEDSMLPGLSVGVMFASLAAALREGLPEGVPSVTITQMVGYPRVGRLVLVTSADEDWVEGRLTVALNDHQLMITEDPHRRSSEHR